MRPRYVLPCPCGQETAVEATQAGQEIRCACGAVLEIPSMRGLSELERAEAGGAATTSSSASGRAGKSRTGRAARTPDIAPTAARWGSRQKRVFLGALIAAVGLALVVILYVYRPRLPEVESLSPLGTWRLWHELREGLEWVPSWEGGYITATAANRRWTIVAAAIALGGVLLMASSLLVARKAPTRPANPPAPQARRRGRKAET